MLWKCSKITLKGFMDAQPGDLIEIFRGVYQHWALYIGGSEVVHLTSPAALGNLVGTVRRQKIGEVVDGDPFQINNLWDHRWRPRDRAVVVMEACSMEDEELLYNTVTFNCEHFVTALRYGRPESRQVTTATTIAGATLVGVGLVALGAALFGAMREEDEEDGKRQRRRHRRRRQ
ncbi:phospholipase A and acyltransferase 3-like isoform 2-T6 [Spinachia spinachia]